MKNLWNSWKILSKRIGDFQAKVIFSLLYFLFFIPLNYLTGDSDYLHTKSFPRWQEYDDNFSSLKKLKKQS